MLSICLLLDKINKRVKSLFSECLLSLEEQTRIKNSQIHSFAYQFIRRQNECIAKYLNFSEHLLLSFQR